MTQHNITTGVKSHDGLCTNSFNILVTMCNKKFFLCIVQKMEHWQDITVSNSFVTSNMNPLRKKITQANSSTGNGEGGNSSF